MKKIIILLIALAAILGIAFYKKSERDGRLHRSTSSVKLRDLLFPEFDINGFSKIRVKEDKGETTIVVKDNTWVVAERGGYPANKEKLQTALMSLKYEKIKDGRRVGKDSWGKIGVNSPGDATATGVGTLVELFDENGTVKHSFVLGSQVTSSGGREDQMSMFGGNTGNRFIRLKNEDTIWEIGDQLPDLVTKPDAWLEKTFLDIQKIKSVEVIAAKPEDSWKASRPTHENPEFTLEGAKPNEKLDGGKVSLATLLSSPTFNDVVSKDKAAETMKDATKAIITTFDGFTYNLQVVKKKVADADKYYLAVTVSADLPKERAPVKDEKPEDKKKNDDAFAEEKTKKEEKLANEKRLEGWAYEVTEYTVSSLLKTRAEVLADPTKAPNSPTGVPGAPRAAGLPDVRSMLQNMPQATPPAPPSPEANVPAVIANPPATLPQPPKAELKPAPAPDAPAVPAPAPAPAPAPTPAPEPAKPAAAEDAKK